jgi:hypothetical protein
VKPWADCNAWAIPRLLPRSGFEGRTFWLAVDLGNGQSDPILSVGVECKLRPRAAKWLDWLLPDRDRAEYSKGWCSSR